MNELLEIKYFELKQLTNNIIGYGVITYEKIRNIVKFTERASDEIDPFLDPEELSKEKQRSERYYQRLRETIKVNSIKNFILKEIIRKRKYDNQQSMSSPLGTFPTSIMLAINLFNADNDSSLAEYKELPHQGLCYIDKPKNTLYIPNFESVLIVDGQHRIAGLNSLNQDILDRNVKYEKKNIEKTFGASIYDYLKNSVDNFEFLCILLIDFDLYEQGEIFANTNFNQKPVNRSIYYDIFGTSPNTEKNSLKFAHDIVAHLNYSSKSPLHKRIKMLGTGEGLVSQAAMVEFFTSLFSPKRVWSQIYSDYLSNGQEYKFITVFIRAYLEAFKEVFHEYWPLENEVTSRQYKNILCKTTGLGAIIRLIEKLYPYVKSFRSEKVDLLKNDTEMKKILVDKIKNVSYKGGEYFSGDDQIGRFAKGAGKGLQAALYNEMAIDLGFINQKKDRNDLEKDLR